MEDFYQRVAEKCLLKYKQISKRRKRNDRQWTPLASVVQHTLIGRAREPYSYALVNFMPHPPTPGEGGGFDKLSRQMSHPWGQPSCQIPTMSPGPSRGLGVGLEIDRCITQPNPRWLAVWSEATKALGGLQYTLTQPC